MKTEDLDNISYDIKNYILMSFLTPVFTQIYSNFSFIA